MKSIKEPGTANLPSGQDLLFDTEQYSWWASQLHPSAVRMLEQGFEGVFRRSLLRLMPAHELGKHFDEKLGRPTKELYSMAGLLLIAEFRNYTVEETAKAYTCDASVQFALDIQRDRQYVCPRTIDNYRKIFRENELAQQVFLDVTSAIVTELDIDISLQRCDSTHVLSNMASFSRYQLLGTAAKRFLNAIKKNYPDQYEAIDEILRKRYEASDQRLYFGEVANPSKVTTQEKRTIITQIGEDQLHLIDRFANDETIAALDAYRLMKRAFEEHFEIEVTKVEVEEAADQLEATEKADSVDSQLVEEDLEKTVIKTRKSSVAADGTKTNTLQNTSDEDAGYGGHKGSGFQAQIAQTLPPKDEEGQAEGPGIITAVIPESAANFDGNALEPLLEQQKENGLLPEEMTADSHYGSDENVCMAKDHFDVDIVSPVSGASQYPEKKNSTKQEPKAGTKAAEAKAKKDRLDQRREQQETDEWKQGYASRSGIEGLNRALDLKTGFKKLRVRGLKAVGMCLYLKAVGWNISSAAKIKVKRARKAAFLIPTLIYRKLKTVTELCRKQLPAPPWRLCTPRDNFHNYSSRNFLFCVDVGTVYHCTLLNGFCFRPTVGVISAWD